MDKEYSKLFHVLAVMFLIREKQANDRKDYGAAVAYANAYDLLCYTVGKNKDYLLQFDGMSEAIEFAFEHRGVAALWELEEIFRKERE